MILPQRTRRTRRGGGIGEGFEKSRLQSIAGDCVRLQSMVFEKRTLLFPIAKFQGFFDVFLRDALAFVSRINPS